MNKKLTIPLFIFIMLIAGILRFWQLGSVPVSPDWDEAALGYNAYSILKTGRDEYGSYLPMVLRSFDDYKPALYAYLIIPLLPLFDLNAFTVRLPSAIMGLTAVAAVYFLVKELFNRDLLLIHEKKVKTEYLALCIAFIFAISPWHLQFSRVAFEANVGLTFNILIALFFLKGLRNPAYYLFSVTFAAFSIYTYQSEKVFTPLLALGLITIYRKDIFKQQKKYLYLTLVFGFFLMLPLLIYTLNDTQVFARAKGVSIFSEKTSLLKDNSERLIRDNQRNDVIGLIFDNRRVVYTKTILANYISHFDAVWLFIKGDYDVNRHHAPYMGLEYLIHLPFLFIGMYILLFGSFSRKAKLLLIYWLIIAPIPASITTGVPHAVRTLNILPVLEVFIGTGLIGSLMYLISNTSRAGSYRIVSYGIMMFYGIFFLLNFSYYLNQYFVQQNYYHSLDWQYGYKELVEYIRPNLRSYNKVIISNSGNMTQSYMFFLFYLKYDPVMYLKEGGTGSGGFAERGNKFANLEFRTFDIYQEKKNDVLFVGTDVDFPEEFQVIRRINYLDGTPAIKVVEAE